MVKFELPKWERRERAPDPPGVTISEDHLKALSLMGWGAYIALLWFLWSKVLHVSQQQFETMTMTHFLFWEFEINVYFPLVIGYVFVALTVPYVAKWSIPTFVRLSWREAPWPKGLALAITLLVSMVLISGTATVGGNAILESERGAAVAVAEIEQQQQTLDRQIERKRGELRDMMGNSNAYLAQAASVGAARWQSGYIDRTPANDPQRDRIVRALGAAQAADDVRTAIAALESQRDGLQTTAAVSSEVNTSRTGTLNTVMDFLNTFWILLLALVMDIVCLLIPWIREELRLKRNRELANATFTSNVDEAHMIPDFREEAPIVSQPMDAPQTAVFDAETGERLIKVKPKEHWRRAPKGKKQKVDVAETPAGDEAGVFDASRTGQSEPAANALAENVTNDEAARQEAAFHHDIETEMQVHAVESTPAPAASQVSDDEWAAMFPEHVAVTKLPEGEGVMVNDNEQDAHVRDYKRQLEVA